MTPALPLLAQMPAASPDVFRDWLLCLGGAAGLAYFVLRAINEYRALHKPAEPRDVPENDRPVRRADFVTVTERVDRIEVALAERATRLDLREVRDELKEMFQRFEEYTHKRNHDQADSLQTLGLRLEAQIRDCAIGIVRLATKIEGHVPTPEPVAPKPTPSTKPRG